MTGHSRGGWKPRSRVGRWAHLLTLGLTALGAGCQSATHSHGPAPVLTQAERDLNVKSFDIVWQTIKDRHFDPTLNGADWDKAKTELRHKVALATTMNEARADMMDLIGRLKQSHFGIIPSTAYGDVTGESSTDSQSGKKTPDEKVAKTDSPEKPKTKDGVSGLHFRWVDGQLLVTKVEDGSAGDSAGVKPGWTLVSVDGRETGPIIDRVVKSLPPHTHPPTIVAFSFDRQFQGNVGEKIQAEFLDRQGTRVAKTVTLTETKAAPTTFGNLPTMHIEFDSKKIVAPAGGDIGYVSFSMFFDPPNIMPKLAAAMDSFKDCRGVIIDMRGNPGGIGAMAMGVGSYFVSEPHTLGTMTTRGGAVKFVVNPRGNSTSAPLAILVDETSASTAEIFAGGMKDIGRARVFGTRTAAMALPSTIDKLPNGDGFQYAFANYVSAGGKELEGLGVTPDEITPPTRESLLAGHDAAMEAAVAWITSPHASEGASKGQ